MDRRPFALAGTPRSRLVALATAALAFFALAPSEAATAAADSHAYPRTYHIYGGWSPSALARYDMVVGYESNWDVAALRRANPNGVFLVQPGLNPRSSDYQTIFVSDSGSSMAKNWAGASDATVGGVNVGWIRPIDRHWDLLHEASGKVLGGWNLADPKGKGTPEFVAKLFAYAAKLDGLYTKGWDGVHSDNWNFTSIGADWYYGPRLDTDRDGRIDDYTILQKNWANGLTRASNLIRSYLPGKVVGGNGNSWRVSWYEQRASDPQGWLKSSNYTLIEHFDQFYGRPQDAIAQARRWLDYPDPYGQPRYLASMQQALNCAGGLFEIPSTADPNQTTYMLDPCVMRSMRWGLTLALMADIYYEIYIPRRHSTRWWYDEFDGGDGIRQRGYLGRVLGDPQFLSAGVYRRDFANGLAIHNSSSAAVTVPLEAMYRKLKGTQNPSLNDGGLVRSVTVPAKDGVILLRTTPVAGPAPPAPPPPPSTTEPPVAPAPAPAPSAPSGSPTLTFFSEADARVHESAPTTNYWNQDLRVVGGSASDVETFIRFVVSGASGTIRSAKLKLFAYTATASGPSIASAATTWPERLTWNTRPATLGPPVNTLASATASRWIEFDVTPLVTGNGTYAFALRSSSADDVDFYSREDGKAPILELTIG